MKDKKQRMRIRNVLTMAVTLPHHNHHRQQKPLPCVYREILGLYYFIIRFEILPISRIEDGNFLKNHVHVQKYFLSHSRRVEVIAVFSPHVYELVLLGWDGFGCV